MKRLLLMSITLAVAALAGVQPATARDVRVGFVGGVSCGHLWGARGHTLFGGLYDYGYRYGLVLGADVVIPLHRRWSFQPGVFYANRGAKYSYSDSYRHDRMPYEQELTFELDYIEVPLLLRVDDRTGPLFALLGPTVAFNVGSRVHGAATAGHRGHSETIRVDEKIEDVRTLDLGVTCGVGIDLPVRGVPLVLDARYTVGLRSIDASHRKEMTRNWGFLIMTGVRL